MNTPDLSPLVKGIVALIGVALALGQFGNLEQWASNQAMEAIMWKKPLPYFFDSQSSDGKVHQRHIQKESLNNERNSRKFRH
jgi:hypothetical protein